MMENRVKMSIVQSSEKREQETENDSGKKYSVSQESLFELSENGEKNYLPN